MTNTPISTPRICLIGVSGYATVYVDWLLEAQQAGRIDIGAVVALKHEQSIDAAQRLAATGAKIYDNYVDLFKAERGKIDLAYIPTGIQWHARMTVAALEAGCNVLVEKPLAGSVADAKLVRDAETRTGRWVAVGFQDMYTDEMKALKTSIVRGRIGKVRSVSMIGIWPRPQSYYERNHWAGRLWADDAQVLDSPLNNAFAHFVNLALFLAGPDVHRSQLAKVTECQLFRAHKIENFDTAVVHAVGRDGMRFWFGVSHSCSATREPSIRIVGTEGAIEWFHESRCEISANGSPIQVEHVPNYDTTRRKMFETVLKRLQDPDTPICDTEIATCHTALIESIQANGLPVSVDPALIDIVPHPSCESTIPSIRNLDAQLAQAFETLGLIDNLRPAEVSK